MSNESSQDRSDHEIMLACWEFVLWSQSEGARELFLQGIYGVVPWKVVYQIYVDSVERAMLVAGLTN